MLKQANLVINTNNLAIDSNIKDSEFEDIMNDDFNTPNTITYLLELVKSLNSEIRSKGNNISGITSKILVICDVLGLKYDMAKFNEEDIELYNNWMNARNEKNFEKADMYRNKLVEKNIL